MPIRIILGAAGAVVGAAGAVVGVAAGAQLVSTMARMTKTDHFTLPVIFLPPYPHYIAGRIPGADIGMSALARELILVIHILRVLLLC